MTDLIEKPASDETIRAIQRIARKNELVYSAAFAHVPKGVERRAASSIWPVCPMNSSKETAADCVPKMPFDIRFWKSKSTAKISGAITGYFTALPMYWTATENNHPGAMSVMLLTQTTPQQATDVSYG